jgi:hypothetical protein
MLIEMLVKIGGTALVFFIVALIADSYCASVHKSEPENKNIDYKTHPYLDGFGLTSAFTLFACGVLAVLVGIWS